MTHSQGREPEVDWRSEEMARLYRQVQECCASKADEFALLGYDSVTAEEVWACVTSAYREVPPLHRVVNDVLSLKVTRYMNWVMTSMYKNGNAI